MLEARLRKLRRHGRWTIACLGVLLLVMTFQKMNRLTPHPRSRVITVERLIDAGTWAHIAPGDTTPMDLSLDMVRIGERFYSSKPPIYPLLMAAEAGLVNRVTGAGFHDNLVDYLRILVILNQILPYLLLLWALWAWMLRQTQDPWTLYIMLGGMSLGMLAFGYAVTLNNHTPSSLLYLGIFLLWDQISRRGKEEGWRFALLGLLAGFAVAIETPSGGIALWFLALAVARNWKKGGLALLCSAMPVALNLGLYAHLSGNWRPFYFDTDLYKFPGSYWENPQGLDAERPSLGMYIFHSLFGFRGIFSMSPLLLLGVVSVVQMVRGKLNFYRREFLGIGLGILALMVYIWNNTYNYGGACIGMRWFICFMPLLWLAAFPLVQSLTQHLWGRILLVVGLLWAIPWNLEALWEEAFITGLFERTWWAIF